jgi:NTP pyrophosphatase (non-canonical NTP hydrolase)
MSPATALPQPLSLPEYALKAKRTNRFENQENELDKLRFGYVGEIGGLLSAVKKSGRDKLKEEESQLASEELGDALWYLFATAQQLEITPNELGISCVKIVRKRFEENDREPSPPVSFRQIDGILDVHRESWDIVRSRQLGKLAHAAGILADMSPGQLTSMARPAKLTHFGNILAELAITCACFHLHLEDVARENLEKIASRWPWGEKVYPPLFDSDDEYPDYERFPRTFDITFVERGGRATGHVVQSLNGVFVGDRLTDNSNEPDDYRFHDIFHLAYIAYLGWSPVIRGLLKRKRKSSPKIDETEDGARAMIIEEGIATWIFNHAKVRDFYENVEDGTLEYGLLKQIHSMVDGYEVDKCKLWQWELAILRGFEIFRSLKEHRGGTVSVDMLEHTLTYAPPETA